MTYHVMFKNDIPCYVLRMTYHVMFKNDIPCYIGQLNKGGVISLMVIKLNRFPMLCWTRGP